MHWVNINESLNLPLLAGLAVAPVLALVFGVAEVGSDEPGFLCGGPAASWRSLLNSNFLFTGAYEKNTQTSFFKIAWQVPRHPLIICFRAQKNVTQLCNNVSEKMTFLFLSETFLMSCSFLLIFKHLRESTAGAASSSRILLRFTDSLLIIRI